MEYSPVLLLLEPTSSNISFTRIFDGKQARHTMAM